jgi:organic hydroperoxide reductase OsmC/OhrA
MREHRYSVGIEWTGNRGTGTSGYRDYDRSHRVQGSGKPPIPGSSDPAFRGDAACWNPEEMLVASVAACHQLWYLHLAAAANVVVIEYLDRAEGVMTEEASGAGQFAEVVLHPRVVIARGGDPDVARALHARAHEFCFIANSVKFPIRCVPEIVVSD